VSVAKGDSLAEGDAVGALAGDGDGSSAETHLHVGVRRGDLYVDPLSVLTSPVALSVAPGGNAPAGVGATQGSASAGTAAAVHAATVGRTASSAGAAAASAARAHVAAAVRGGVPVGLNAGSSALHPAVPGASLAPGVSVGGVAPRAAPSYAAASAESALTRLRAVGLSPAGAQATARVAGSTLDAVLAQARRTAGQAARVAGMAAATVLGGIGLLWPLWRREERKGSGEDRVSAIADDVAAAVGR